MVQISANVYSFVNSMTNPLITLFIMLASNTDPLDFIFVRGFLSVIFMYWVIGRVNKKKTEVSCRRPWLIISKLYLKKVTCDGRKQNKRGTCSS